MKFKNIIKTLMGTNDFEDDIDDSVDYIEGSEPEIEEREEFLEEQEQEQEEEYIGDLPESTIREIFIDLYSQLDIQPTQGQYRLYLDGWRDGLVNLQTATVKSEITAPKNMEEFGNLCMAFKGMLEEQVKQELDINFVRGYCYCLCFFMPNK